MKSREILKSILRDKDGITFKYPNRRCKDCSNFPCIKNMSKLKCDFAKYGCRLWSNANIFNIEEKKKQK